ncbi:SRPBCC family protein [Labrys wisconsinensis]|uniref:Phenylpropionate dioxygenase-like ring-hydroxylating dioxygenase large terminal subunit/AcrR family transcriptional regulator n=1 Tax=Labrys wisconsinensis TaxID=425677 RepID=A0ABU0JNX8_9HYPH|nr:SRPBCC family protein [Labrys wisconsinensis]MDQ0475350.1 phenylpropionate dioxygenase-like ring-hydroxylating dioxygenase large terminal subunit/AcrR family transcriptional regulator [Labrys wisconsinensis]
MLDRPGKSARMRRPQEERREQLLEAAMEAIARHGLSNVTLEKVAKLAGLTAGMVNFHFTSKQDLLAATIGRLADEHREACEAAVAPHAGKPVEAIMALLAVNFDKTIATPVKLAVWTAFWGESGARADYMAVCGASDRAYQDAVRALVADLVATAGVAVDARSAALGLCGLVDNLWQEALVEGEAFDHAAGLELCRLYLKNLFPSLFAADPPQDKAAETEDLSEEERDYLARLTLPAWTYRDAAFSAAEVERVHLPAWHVLCHVGELPTPGDYVTMEVLGKRVLAMRGEDGAVRVFHNVCRHRAHAIAPHRQGHTDTVLQCPYHAWCYDTQGVLRGIAASRTFPKLDKANLGLFPVDSEIFCGFVFVRFAPGGASVAERYAPYAEELAPYAIADMVPISDYWQGTVEADWKNVWDNYLEDYHFPVGHPGLSALMAKDYDREPDHATRTIRLSHVMREEVRGDWSTRMYARLLLASEHLPPAQRRRWSYFYMYPGVAIETFPDQVDFYHITPLGPGRSRIRWRSYGPRQADRQLEAVQYLGQRINFGVHHEDNALIESVQENLNAGTYERGVLSDKEVNVRALHDWVRQDMPQAR